MENEENATNRGDMDNTGIVDITRRITNTGLGVEIRSWVSESGGSDSKDSVGVVDDAWSRAQEKWTNFVDFMAPFFDASLFFTSTDDLWDSAVIRIDTGSLKVDVRKLKKLTSLRAQQIQRLLNMEAGIGKLIIPPPETFSLFFTYLVQFVDEKEKAFTNSFFLGSFVDPAIFQLVRSLIVSLKETMNADQKAKLIRYLTLFYNIFVAVE